MCIDYKNNINPILDLSFIYNFGLETNLRTIISRNNFGKINLINALFEQISKEIDNNCLIKLIYTLVILI